MGMSELPPPPEERPGEDPPVVRVRPPGPQSRTWLTRLSRTAAPMGPAPRKDPTRVVAADVPANTIVYAKALGANVLDVDGNRYVDLAAGFGAQLVGHRHPAIARVLALQSERLLQALGDVHPADARIALGERLARLYPEPGARVILGQSGADAVSAALKTAALFTERPGVIAFDAGYHGLSYGPLAVSGFRAGYREPFAAQLNPHVTFVPYPRTAEMLEETRERVRFELSSGRVGALLFEPVLGRGGVVLPPTEMISVFTNLCRDSGALLIADEIWTGLGRTGRWLCSVNEDQDVVPDLICLGKGLGGGLPVSACIGRDAVMQAWRREPEVMHTATFSGAPLACATAIATLDVVAREKLVERAAEVGGRFVDALRTATSRFADVAEVRGAGMMIGVDLGRTTGAATALAQRLLERGYIVSTGGAGREVLVLTPPLNIAEELLEGFVAALTAVLIERA